MPLPAAVVSLAGDVPPETVWVNLVGGTTWRLAGDRWLKWAPAGSGTDLRDEAERMAWAASWATVPDVLDAGATPDGTWLLTAGLPGASAVAPRWKADPAVAVAAIGAGLAAWHDAGPVASCPWSWSADTRLAGVRVAAEAGQLRPSEWHDEHEGLGVAGALAVLDDPPEDDLVVVAHGDACAPNTLVADDGRPAGHVDLGALGVADRWADLAVAAWSCDWNYGPGWAPTLLAAYGIRDDPDRRAWYRLLWDLG